MATIRKHCGRTRPHDPHEYEERKPGLRAGKQRYRCAGSKSLFAPKAHRRGLL